MKEEPVIREPMPAASPYGRLVIHRLPTGPCIKSVADHVLISESLLNEIRDQSAKWPASSVQGSRLVIHGTNHSVIYRLGVPDGKGAVPARLESFT